MNWIIKSTDKLIFHTNLDILLKPIENEIKDLKWLISDLEINTSEMDKLPINNKNNSFLISATEMDIIRKTDTQIVWGVFSGIKSCIDLKQDQIDLPFAEGNSVIWENGGLQLNDSKIEIIAWDSSYTIVKFTDKVMSIKFKEYFEEAIELEKFN